jgi:pyruvate dehydrogenase E2 component (dihydrolipoamide acetyltransferase)
MTTEVLVPPLGQTVDSVTLVAWYKSEGEAVRQGERLFAIETDKATLDIEAPSTGVLREVTAGPGDEVQVLSTIAVLVAPGEAVESKRPDRGRKTTAPVPVPEAPKRQPRPVADRIFVSPRARRLAEEHGLSLALFKATGPEGAIIERDVRAYLDARIEARTSPLAREDAVATRSEGEPAEGKLLESLPARAVGTSITVASAADGVLRAETEVTALVTLRRQLAGADIDISYNALLLRILGVALREHPRLNATLEKDTIQVWRRVHVGLAVDSDRGLLVPVMRDVNRKGLAQLEEESQSLVERARAGRCLPEEFSGGTFTLANLDRFGIDSFTPLVPLSEGAVLGVGRIKTLPFGAGDQVIARQTMWLSLSFDRRLVDVALAARFAQRVVQLIEHPYLLLS